MSVGMFLAAISFVIAGVLQYQMEVRIVNPTALASF